MDVNAIGNLIATLGFPIVAAAALFWYMNKQQENHKEETNALRDSIEKNSLVLAELKELIKYLVSELKGNDKGN